MDTTDNKTQDFSVKDFIELNDQLNKYKKRAKQLEKERRVLEELVRELKTEINALKSPPLMYGVVMDKIDGDKYLVKTSNGVVFCVKSIKDVNPGDNVLLHQVSLAIVEKVETTEDVFIKSLEVIEKPKVSFRDIGGLEEQIQEIKEVVDLPLKHPEKFEKLGIEPPKGVLLYGPPGTGKTLLAKAVASDCNVKFIRVSASELVQKFIGEGAKLVKKLFEYARKNAPCILFIDEIDAIGTKRVEDTTGGEKEVNRTMLQLLAEMDGFNPLDKVKIIAATNRPDILDPALLRPGRFDRLIEVHLPNKESRKEIFKIYLNKMNKKDIDLDELVRLTSGFSGADIKAVCTEAGYFAIRDGKDYITQKDLIKGIEKASRNKKNEHIIGYI
jgi:proteasome regulatory subunit